MDVIFQNEHHIRRTGSRLAGEAEKEPAGRRKQRRRAAGEVDAQDVSSRAGLEIRIAGEVRIGGTPDTRSERGSNVRSHTTA